MGRLPAPVEDSCPPRPGPRALERAALKTSGAPAYALLSDAEADALVELKRGRRVCAGGGCVDSPSWWAAKRNRDCDYVAKKAATLCASSNVDASGVSALDACGASCGAC